MSWPVLSRRPRSEQHREVENVVMHQTENGTVLRRRKFTRDKVMISLDYDLMISSQADLIKALYSTNNKHSSFSFTDKASVVRTVVFDTELEFVEPIPGWVQFSTITLKEV